MSGFERRSATRRSTRISAGVSEPQPKAGRVPVMAAGLAPVPSASRVPVMAVGRVQRSETVAVPAWTRRVACVAKPAAPSSA